MNCQKCSPGCTDAELPVSYCLSRNRQQKAIKKNPSLRLTMAVLVNNASDTLNLTLNCTKPISKCNRLVTAMCQDQGFIKVGQRDHWPMRRAFGQPIVVQGKARYFINPPTWQLDTPESVYLALKDPNHHSPPPPPHPPPTGQPENPESV